jgi:hypothetical protein
MAADSPEEIQAASERAHAAANAARAEEMTALERVLESVNRDPAAWELVADKVLPRLRAKADGGDA